MMRFSFLMVAVTNKEFWTQWSQSALLCWWKKMKEHDLGKDYLAPGPAYRAVPSRETLPGSEIDPYQLSKVQVSLTGLTDVFVVNACYSWPTASPVCHLQVQNICQTKEQVIHPQAFVVDTVYLFITVLFCVVMKSFHSCSAEISIQMGSPENNWFGWLPYVTPPHVFGLIGNRLHFLMQPEICLGPMCLAVSPEGRASLKGWGMALWQRVGWEGERRTAKKVFAESVLWCHICHFDCIW